MGAGRELRAEAWEPGRIVALAEVLVTVELG